VYDSDRPIGGTGDMRAWYTTRPNLVTIKSQISHVVGDAGWEGYAAGVFERRNDVAAYAKNDHLGFQIVYMWLGSRRKFTPDFLIRLANGRTLVLEIKGRDSPQDKAKREALAEWIAAINSDKGFGEWSHAVAFSPNEIDDIVHRHAAA
jgi:type III restriction enzyme